MKRLEDIYPPYIGSEPFIFLCFEAEDTSAAEPILRRLWQRGCRIWYPPDGASERDNQKQIEKASLVLVVNTAKFAVSKAKRDMMFLQSRGIPVIVADCVRSDVVSTGEHAGTVHISALNGFTDSVEAKIITAEGFSQDFIGQRPAMPTPGWIKGVFTAMAVMVVAAALFLGLNIAGIVRPRQEPDEVRTLSLDHVPDDPKELEQYPNLDTVIIPQSEAGKAEALLDRYTVVLGKGN